MSISSTSLHIHHRAIVGLQYYLSPLLVTLTALLVGVLLNAFSPKIALATSDFHSSNPVSTPRSSFVVVSGSREASPGQKISIGLEFELEKDWHIYWKNHGDYGLKPSFLFGTQFRYGKVQWPAPRKIEVPPYTSYGYEGRVRFLTTATVPQDAVIGSELLLEVEAQWLVCKVDCIPEEASVTLPIQIKATPQRGASERLTLLPAALQKEELLGEGALDLERGTFHLRVPLPTDRIDAYTPHFIPETPGLIDPSSAQEVDVSKRYLSLLTTATPQFTESITELRGLLLLERKPNDARPIAYPVALTTSTAPLPELPSADREESGTKGKIGLFTALWFAFIGGLILNVMPCVLPVLSIKLFTLMNLGKAELRRARLEGVLYTLGIVLSMVLLAAVMLGLRAGGTEVGWGFHLQSPVVVGFLMILFFVLGLQFLAPNRFGNRLSTQSAMLADKVDEDTPWRALVDGALAVAVATPCTAPFMGTALGATLTMSGPATLSVFAVLGLGLAFPFLIASFVPQVAAFFPKPGAWMETVKQALSFPLFAAALWLLTIQLALCGNSGLVGSLVVLWLMALLFWILGRVSSLPALLSVIFAGLLTVFLYLQNINGLTPPTALPAETAGPNQVHGPAGLDWRPFSEQDFARLKKQNDHISFVDFTADWCLTCKYNSARVFSSEKVLAFIKKHKVRLMRGDWTRQDPAITRILQQYGRAGVPLVIILGPGLPNGERVMPSWLSPSDVVETFEQALGQ